MRRTLILSAIALALVLIVGFFAFITVPSRNGSGEADGGAGSLFGSLFPFNFGGGDAGGGDTPLSDEPLEDTRPVPPLRKVSDGPSAGGFFFEKKSDDGAEEAVGIRFVERQTGHVYETATDTLTARRISNTTIPGIEEVLWQDKNNFIIRYLEGEAVRTFRVELDAAAEGEQSVNGSFLDSWDRAALDPTREEVLAVFETGGGSRAALFNFDGSGLRSVFTSPLASWVPLQSEKGAYLASAPASGVPGFLYRLSNQTLIKIVGGISGFMPVVSPSGRYVLYSSADGSRVELFLYDTESRETFESPLDTLAVKCAFVSTDAPTVACGVPSEFPKGAYPNDWLLGRVAFSDDIWLIDPTSGLANLLALPEIDAGVPLDVAGPAVDPSGGYLGFINKNDLSFWTLSLKQQ